MILFRQVVSDEEIEVIKEMATPRVRKLGSDGRVSTRKWRNTTVKFFHLNKNTTTKFKTSSDRVRVL